MAARGSFDALKCDYRRVDKQDEVLVSCGKHWRAGTERLEQSSRLDCSLSVTRLSLTISIREQDKEPGKRAAQSAFPAQLFGFV